MPYFKWMHQVGKADAIPEGLIAEKRVEDRELVGEDGDQQQVHHRQVHQKPDNGDREVAVIRGLTNCFACLLAC